MLGRTATAPGTARAGGDATPQPTSSAGVTLADPLPARPLTPTRVTATSTSAGAVYSPDHVVDGRPDTAWAADGDGGVSITLSFGEPVRIQRIGMIPGDARVDPAGDRVDHYTETGRVRRARLEFSEGGAVRVEFSDDDEWDMEFVTLDVVTDSVTIDVLSTRGGTQNRVAISEVAVFGAEAQGVPEGPVEALPSSGLVAERIPPAQPPPPAEVDGPYVFPVYPPARASYGPGHNSYPGTDLYSPCGTAVVAPTSGTLDEVQPNDRWNPRHNLGPTRGGIFVSLIGDDGVRYYISHFAELASGLRPGDAVAAGALLGTVGRTGTAHNTPCHLHFGISPPGSGPRDWRPRRGVVDPFPYLEAWREGRERSPRKEVARAG